ncbi:hypothetical protein PPYR_00964 [Photinus pyralis]|uniref:CCC domain-containing protein n=1 Tax=Photinus pyralis TaxID=7054 RepID=A0A1Y1MSL4_PHOPY|nr:uncharacterized protein LOC116159705 [Photinus pyralis]KAB0803994.1 hypothetical protein PPYR_00964 [Photinus pyralis]
MCRNVLGCAVAFFFLLLIWGITSQKQIIAYEEYVIEHEISMEHARNAALAIDLNSIETPPGCQKCSKSEIKYCLGSDFINDHCCCDKRYHEVLPYIPHTCYLGTQLCKPIAGDCLTYKTIRKCCCTRYLINKWKSSAPRLQGSIDLWLLFLMIVVVR